MCMGPQYIKPYFGQPLTFGTQAGAFTTYNTCTWIVTPPHEISANVEILVSFTVVEAASCYMNFGSSILTANGALECEAEKEYTFSLNSQGHGNVYITVMAEKETSSVIFSVEAVNIVSFDGIIGASFGLLGGVSLILMVIVLIGVAIKIKASSRQQAMAFRTVGIDIRQHNWDNYRPPR